jgi:hypothetical protein
MSYQFFADGEQSLYLVLPSEAGTLRWHGLPSPEQGLSGFAVRSGRGINAQPLVPFQTMFAGDNGVIYAVVRSADRSTSAGFDTVLRDGDLVQYLDISRDGTAGSLSGPVKLGSGWGGHRHIFSNGGGRIYTVSENGDLQWHRCRGPGVWEGPQVIGSGWGNFKHVFSGGVRTTESGQVEAVIYAIDEAGTLLSYLHTDAGGGSYSWALGGGAIQLATGFSAQAVCARGGFIFVVNADGQLSAHPVANHLTGSASLGAAIAGLGRGFSPAPTTMSVASGKVDITPSLTEGAPNYNPYLGGFLCGDIPRRMSSATPYAQPLYARCLVLWDSRGPKVIVSADVLAFSRPMHESIRRRVLALRDDWQSSDFILQATHTHNGPVLVDKLHLKTSYNLPTNSLEVVKYSAWLETEIVALVTRTLAQESTPCTLDYQVGTSTVGFNRCKLPNVERDVPVLTARSPSGKPLAVLFNYACHPVAGGGQALADGDFPGGACAHIEASPSGPFALFMQGACGDHNPSPAGSWEARNQAATALGGVVLNALRDPGRTLYGPFATRSAEATLPLDIDLSSESLATRRTALVKRRDEQAKLKLDGNVFDAAGYHRAAAEMIRVIDEAPSSIETSVKLPLQLWKLEGSPGLRWLLTGGELVSGYAVWARSHYGGSDQIMVSGYAGEIPCYIPTDEFRPDVGSAYEGGWDSDNTDIAGGNLNWYFYLGHFKFGTDGVQDTMQAALTSLLTDPQS